jgi:hypothetical protein
MLLSQQQLEAAKAAALAAMPKFVGGRPDSAPAAAAAAPAVSRATPAARSSIPSPSAALAGSYARGEQQATGRCQSRLRLGQQAEPGQPAVQVLQASSSRICGPCLIVSRAGLVEAWRVCLAVVLAQVSTQLTAALLGESLSPSLALSHPAL